MMMRSIFLRTLYDKRWFALGWACALSGMALLMIAMYPSLHDGMKQIAATMPPQLQGLVGDINMFGHLDTYLSSQLYDIRIPLFLMIMAVVLAQNLTVGAEERGDMRTLLSTTVSRSGYFFQTFLAALVIFLVTLLATVVTTLLSVPFIKESIDLVLVLQLAGLSLVFAMTMFGIVYSIGMGTGRRSLVMAVGVGIIVLSIVLEAGRTVDWLEAAQKISLLHYYDAGKLLTDGLNLIHMSVLAGLLLVSTLGGWLLYRQRDIGSAS